MTTEVSLTDMKQGEIYETDAVIESRYGYRLGPGQFWVEQVTLPDTIYAVNLKTGTRETFYPAPKKLPIRRVEASDDLLAKLHTSMRLSPGGFAGFGAQMLIGTDPELFAVDKTGTLLPAFSFLPDKKQSDKAGWKGTGYHTKAHMMPYWDGFQGEWNVAPFTCIAHLHDCIQGGMLALHRALPSGAKLVANPVLPVPAHYLASEKEEYVQLGCMPSLNVYGDTGLNPGDGRHLPVRFAGYHLHFNLTRGEGQRNPQIVQLMDKLCGVLSVVALQGLEDPIRRRYYGLAGEYRTPAHGLEYRVLSSAVMWHPAVSHLHFNMARCAVQLALKGMDTLWDGSVEEARDCINHLDVELGKTILERNRDLVIGCLRDTYSWGGSLDYAKEVLNRLILPGVAQRIELDVAKNWKLNDTWTVHSSSENCDFGKYSAGFKFKVANTKKV